MCVSVCVFVFYSVCFSALGLSKLKLTHALIRTYEGLGVGVSLRERNGDLHVRLREVAGSAVDAALEPVLVHALDQRDDVVFLKLN